MTKRVGVTKKNYLLPFIASDSRHLICKYLGEKSSQMLSSQLTIHLAFGVLFKHGQVSI